MGENFDWLIALKRVGNYQRDLPVILNGAGDVLAHSIPDLVRILGVEEVVRREVSDGCFSL